MPRPSKELEARKLEARREKGLSDPNDPTTWTIEELEAGRPYNDDGRHVGRPPKTVVLAQTIKAELTKRRLSFAAEHMRDTLELAVKRLRQVFEDDNADHKDWLKAFELLTNRIYGMPRESILVGVANLGGGATERPEPPYLSLVDQMLEEMSGEEILHALDILNRR